MNQMIKTVIILLTFSKMNGCEKLKTFLEFEMNVTELAQVFSENYASQVISGFKFPKRKSFGNNYRKDLGKAVAKDYEQVDMKFKLLDEYLQEAKAKLEGMDVFTKIQIAVFSLKKSILGTVALEQISILMVANPENYESKLQSREVLGKE